MLLPRTGVVEYVVDFAFTGTSATSEGDVVCQEIQQLLSHELYAFAMAPTRA